MTYFGLKTAIVGALAVTGVFATQAIQPAEAGWDICKDVRIKVVNKTNNPIKLVDLDYIDMRIDRKRSENISNRVIKKGKSYTWERNLEKVKNAKIKIRAQYQTLKNGEEAWIKDALAFADEIEADLFTGSEENWRLYETQVSKLPEPQQIDAYQELAFLRSMALETPQSVRFIDAYLPLLSKHGTPQQRDFHNVLEAANEVSATGDYDLAERKLGDLAVHPSNSGLAKTAAYIALSYVQYDNSNEPGSLRSLSLARRYAENIELSPIMAAELEKLSAYVFLKSGAQNTVLQSYKNARDIYIANDLPYESSTIINNLGWIMRQSGAYEESRIINQKTMAALHEGVTASQRFFVHLDCAQLEIQLQNFAAALSCLEEGELYLAEVPERQTSWHVLNVQALARTGNVTAARASYEALLADPKSQHSGFVQSWLPFLKTEVLYAEGRADLAYKQLVELRSKERVEQARAGHLASFEIRNLLDQENRKVIENAELKERLLNRQSSILVLVLVIALGLGGFCFYLVWNRRRAQILSVTDPLTKVLNRRGFWATFEKELEQAHSQKQTVAIGLLDLDGFKLINDVYGHAVGDEILICIANRLRAQLGPSAAIGRLGGDEFAFLLSSRASTEDLQRIANQLCVALGEEIVIEKATIRPGASIGVAAYPDAGATTQELYDCADYVLYSRKRNAPGTAQIFDLKQKSVLTRNREIESALCAADFEEFYTKYQPIIDAQTGEVKGFEALARWRSPTLGDVTPDKFITLAEQTGKIRRLSQVIVRKALRDAATWPAHLVISINLSAQDVASVDAAQMIADEVISSGVSPQRIVFELTETAIIYDKDQTRKALDLLSGLGVALALDDFGTGYSSLNHLHHFPIDQIKVDRSVTAGLNESVEATSIVNLALSLSNSLNIECVVEGVESSSQLDTLVQVGARDLQGYLFARPMLPSDIEAFLQRNKGRSINTFSIASDAKCA
eukprot:g3220.t1